MPVLRFPRLPPRALVLVVVLTGTLVPTADHAQLRQTTATFLDHHPQPRVHALGEATTALDGYSGAIGINPAGIGEPGVIRAGTNGSPDPLLGSSWLPSLFEESVWIASPSLSIQAGRLAGTPPTPDSRWGSRRPLLPHAPTSTPRCPLEAGR